MFEHDNEVVNKSGNRPFADVLKASMSRRNMLKRSAALSATGFLAALAGKDLLTGAATAMTTESSPTLMAQASSGLLNFSAVKIADAVVDLAVPTISDDYEFSVLIPWGTSIQPGGPEYTGDPNSRPSATEQTEMVGIGHDGMWFFAKDDTSNTEGMLCVNHEFGRNTHVLDKEGPENLQDVRLSQHAHGVSVVAIKKNGGTWERVASPNSRRIHVNTPVTHSGPVAGSSNLQNSANNPALGTVNNCANGYTPWGTYLTCEENFNGYFNDSTYDPDTEMGTWVPNERQERYGFSPTGFGYGWGNYDPRFDLSNAAYANEQNRFGWIVEIDPMDGTQVPFFEE